MYLVSGLGSWCFVGVWALASVLLARPGPGGVVEAILAGVPAATTYG